MADGVSVSAEIARLTGTWLPICFLHANMVVGRLVDDIAAIALQGYYSSSSKFSLDQIIERAVGATLYYVDDDFQPASAVLRMLTSPSP